MSESETSGMAGSENKTFVETNYKPSGQRLLGRKILITGAPGGIGREIAHAVAREGADVVLHYHSKREATEAIKAEIEKLNRRVFCVQADVGNYGEVLRMHEEVNREFGKINVLVNNAGINRDTLFLTMDVTKWNEVIAVNLSGVFHCTKAFLEDLIAGPNGRIINITSIVGQMGNIGQANYAASKAGIIGLTKALAKELARKGVTVNAIAPGFIDTPMLAGVPPKVKEIILSQIPLRRFGRPEEVASAVVYLASDEASYVTGHVLNINGGMYL